jgi:hypothetical protein
LFLTIALEKTSECLSLTTRKLKRIWIKDANERGADQPTKFIVKKVKEALLSLRKVALAGTALQRYHRYRLRLRSLAG